MSAESIIYDNPLHLDLQKLVLQERPNLFQHAQIIGMEKQHISIFEKEVVKKQNDKTNKVVDTLILRGDRKCQVKDIRHQEITWDVYNHKIHFLLWGDLHRHNGNDQVVIVKP